MTGYQEILTDPSYCRQIVTLTYPHIGNYGTNAEDRRGRAGVCGGVGDPEPASVSVQFPQRAKPAGLFAKHGHRRHCQISTPAGSPGTCGCTAHKMGCILAWKETLFLRRLTSTALLQWPAPSSMVGLDLARGGSWRKTLRLDTGRMGTGYSTGGTRRKAAEGGGIRLRCEVQYPAWLTQRGCDVTVAAGADPGRRDAGHSQMVRF